MKKQSHFTQLSFLCMNAHKPRQKTVKSILRKFKAMQIHAFGVSARGKMAVFYALTSLFLEMFWCLVKCLPSVSHCSCLSASQVCFHFAPFKSHKHVVILKFLLSKIHVGSVKNIPCPWTPEGLYVCTR